MRKLVLLFFLLYCLNHSFAQTAPQFAIAGKVIDSAKNTPLSFATLTLSNKTTGLSNSILSNDSGFFKFNAATQGRYTIAVSDVGYASKKIDFQLIDKAHTLLIKLCPSQTQLKGINITARRAVVKQEIDRLSYDIQADPDSKALTVLEMMRKVPLLSVDGNDNIELQGSNSYRIFINGKPSPLLVNNAKDILRTMPASSIKKIEVITTPPAKYDSEGLAGIINIITVQKAVDGYSASMGLRYNYPQGPTANFNGTVKTGKLGFSLSGIYGRQQPVTLTAGNSRQTFGTTPSDLLQIGTNVASGHNVNLGAELSYEADSLNLIAASLNYNLNNSDQGLFRTSTFNQGLLFQGYQSSNEGNYRLQGTDVGLNFQHGFKRHKNRLLTLSYLYSFFGNRQQDQINYSQKINFNQADYSQYNNAGAHEQTAQLDYIQPSKKLTVEAGVKAIFRNNFSDFETLNFNNSSNGFVIDPLLTNNFHYHQNVYSAYNSYQFKMSWATLKAGVRLERTHVDATFSNVGTPLNTNYINVVPSVNLQHSLNANSSLIFGFTDRTARPSITQLNPFVDKSNIGFISFGNPDLRPVIRHLFELIYNHSGRATFTTRLAYSFSNNTIESVSSLISDMVSQTTYFNVGKLKNASIYSSLNYPISTKFNLDANGQIAYIKLSGLSNGVQLGNSGVRTTFNSSISYKALPGLRVGFNANYNSPYILLQGRGTNYFGTSLSVTKSWLTDRFSATAILNNPYQKLRRYTSSTESDQFYQTVFTDNYYRTFAVALNYRIGKQAKSVKKNSRGIYNDDLKNN